MMFDTLPFYNISDNELLNAINYLRKLDYERYCIKFDLFDANDYLESNNDCKFNRNITSNECNYIDVENFLQLSDLK